MSFGIVTHEQSGLLSTFIARDFRETEIPDYIGFLTLKEIPDLASTGVAS